MVYLSNSFSLQMQGEYCAETRLATPAELLNLIPTNRHEALPVLSIIGHSDIAMLINTELGIPAGMPQYLMNRVSIHLVPGDILYVGQYVGPRLPEGTTTLPEGAKITFYKVVIREELAQGRDPGLVRNYPKIGRLGKRCRNSLK